MARGACTARLSASGELRTTLNGPSLLVKLSHPQVVPWVVRRALGCAATQYGEWDELIVWSVGTWRETKALAHRSVGSAAPRTPHLLCMSDAIPPHDGRFWTGPLVLTSCASAVPLADCRLSHLPCVAERRPLPLVCSGRYDASARCDRDRGRGRDGARQRVVHAPSSRPAGARDRARARARTRQRRLGQRPTQAAPHSGSVPLRQRPTQAASHSGSAASRVPPPRRPAEWLVNNPWVTLRQRRLESPAGRLASRAPLPAPG